MMYIFTKLDKKTRYENAEIGVEFYNNATASTYFEAKTADGYEISNELNKQKQAELICLLYSSLYPDSRIEELRDIINTCRCENEDARLSAMLDEADSILSEIIEYAEIDECV